MKYYLKPNNLSPGTDDYMAVSLNGDSYTIHDIYDHMTREGSTLTKAEALASFEEITQGIINIVQQGHSVVTPLLNIKPSLSGVFTHEDDRYDENRHQVRINITAGLRLQSTAAEITPHKIAARERQPSVAHFIDNGTALQDQEISPEGGARITGSLLKFDEDDTNQGVFFINTADGTESRVANQMMKNMPSELIFMNPALDPGTYRLEVRTLLNGNTDIRMGALPDELTVT